MSIQFQDLEPTPENVAYSAIPKMNAPAGGLAAPTQVFSYDQIANQLTDGFWTTLGGSPRAFNVATGGTLYVDITGLTAGGQAMARQALDAWASVTGLSFVEIDSSTPPASTWTEGGDAPSGILTTYSMAVGDDFTGTLSTGADRDAIAIALATGQSVTIRHQGDSSNGSATADPYLWLLDASGNVIAQNDDTIGADAALTYQAASTGTHYIRAGSFADNHPGDYRVSVRQTSATVDILFDDEQPGAYSSSSVVGGVIQNSSVNIHSNWAGGSARTDGYYFQTYLHEVGHALGLGHAGNYNGSATYATDAHYLNDSWQASVMSYFHQSENTWLNDDFAYAISPMMADILAVQNLYGAPAANAGNTIYGNGGNTGTYLDAALGLSNPVTFTVFDTSGNDTFDISNYSSHQYLDLRPYSFSDLAGLSGNIGIGRNTIIENGLTGSGNDTLLGNDAANGLSSGFGDDTVDGGIGNDAIAGGPGLDSLFGGDGFDLIEGGSGDNTITGGAGGDLLIGGDVTLAMLTTAYPTWSPPTNAQSLLDAGDLITVWQDILSDTGLA